MPYVKPTVHLSRIAGTALKSFTHGYAQTVVAASQSSYAAQNTNPAGPLADSLIGRFRKSKEARLQNVLHHADLPRQASSAALPAAATRPETSHHDSGLEKYLDAWQKHQRSGAKEWQQFQFARRIDWQPPSTIPTHAKEASDLEAVFEGDEADAVAAPPPMKRSYTTSALDNFDKAFLFDEKAEATALEQVNTAIAEEVQRAREESVERAARSPSAVSAVRSEAPSVTSSIAVTPTDSFSSLESESYSAQLIQLAADKQYGKIPGLFQSMLLSGVQKPTQPAYRALLRSAIVLSPGKHQQVPKALEVYSDMLRRRVVPDAETYGMLIDLLATRASDVVALRSSLNQRLARYGGLEESGKFMFRSSEAEATILAEDSSLNIALKMFDRTAKTTESLPSAACAALAIASAENGRIDDMTRIYQYMESRGLEPQSAIYPAMISAFGNIGDLRNVVEVYDEYQALAIANNAGENAIARIDNETYAAVIKAYGANDRMKGGLKFLADIQASLQDPTLVEKAREVVALQALLPLALSKDATFREAFDLAASLSGRAQIAAWSTIATTAADQNRAEISTQAFETLARQTQDLAAPSMAMLAMHIRNANVDAAEPFWRVLESAPASLTMVEPTTMRAVALIGSGQAERGLRQTRRMFARIRDVQPESKLAEATEQIDEAIELISSFLLKNQGASVIPTNSIELLRMMSENGALIPAITEHLVARFGPEHIARLGQSDLEFLLRVQASMILDELAASDIAGPARFGCLLETVVSRAVMPAVETETMIEKCLVNIDRAELSRLWNSYRYPSTPAMFHNQAPFAPPMVPMAAPPVVAAAPAPPTAAFEDTFDPYAARTDVKGSNAINDLLDRPQSGNNRRQLQDALTKFRHMRRLGRVPRMFTYGKLIEAAAKEHNLSLVQDMLAMAQQDVPFDARYRVVRFGWQQILDHMVAGCLTLGKRDLAARYHQDMLEMGVGAPSANTFGLYITTLKEGGVSSSSSTTKKPFLDEATEAVSIFRRAQAEGVEPSSFLYNALIGKLGKARRIDDALYYFGEMRALGIRPTSVTYGTIVNALCRVSDESFAEEIFAEMESCANYKPRPAPYHSLMQYFLTTKRDRSKVLGYYERMRKQGITPTSHTYKLLIDAHASLEPVNMAAAEAVLAEMRQPGSTVAPEAVHYAALIHAKGCTQRDLPAARACFESALADPAIAPHACLYQALFESLSAHRRTAAEAPALLADMKTRGVGMTAYVANALIHGYTLAGDVAAARKVFWDSLPRNQREPSTYEAMVRAELAAEERGRAKDVVREAVSRGFPAAVVGRIGELVR